MSRLESEFGVLRGRGAAAARSERIDLGLTLLQMCAIYGMPLTRKDQAAWSECGESAIWCIEQKALKKLRVRFRIMKDARLVEAIDILLRHDRRPAKRAELL